MEILVVPRDVALEAFPERPRTREELESVWSEHASRVLPRPELPHVDWSKEMVVIVRLGERPSAGYSIEVESIDTESSPWTVVAREKRPKEGALVPMMITHPFQIIAVPRRDGDPKLDIRR